MWVGDCTNEESMILVAIAALAAGLPRKLSDYAGALIEINRNYFKPVDKPRSHNPSGRSVGRAHTPRVSPSAWRVNS